MSARLFFPLIILFWVLASHASPSLSSPFDAAEAIVAKHPDLPSLLKDHQRFEAYLMEIQNAYGHDKLKAEQIEAIAFQLRQIITLIPELADRLWQPFSDPVDFTIDIDRPSYGRMLHAENWRSYFLKLYRRSSFYAHSPERDSDRARRSLAAKVRELESKLKPDDAIGWKTIRSSREVQLLANVYAFRILDSDKVQNHLTLVTDANIVLNLFREIQDDPRGFLPGDSQIPSSVLTEVKRRLPQLKVLLNRHDLFPEVTFQTRDGEKKALGTTSSTAIRFHTPPRVLHAIWSGFGECVGGAIGSLDALTPERWARMALKKAMFQVAVRNGRINGFVSINPGDIDQRTYGSVDFGSDFFRQHIGKTTVFYEWFKRIEPRLPAAWTGLVVSRAFEDNSAQVLEDVHSSAAYVFGEETLTGPSSTFKVTDPLAERISGVSRSIQGLRQKYGGQMIFDATIPMARERRSLIRLRQRPDEDLLSAEVLRRELSRSPEQVLRFLTMARFEDRTQLERPGLIRELKSDLLVLLESSNIVTAKSAAHLLALYAADTVSGDIRVFQKVRTLSPDIFSSHVLTEAPLEIREKIMTRAALNSMRRGFDITVPDVWYPGQSFVSNRLPPEALTRLEAKIRERYPLLKDAQALPSSHEVASNIFNWLQDHPEEIGVWWARRLTILAPYDHDTAEKLAMILIRKIQDSKTWTELHVVTSTLRALKLSDLLNRKVIAGFDEKANQMPYSARDRSTVAMAMNETMIYERPSARLPDFLRALFLSADKDDRDLALSVQIAVYSADQPERRMAPEDRETEKYVAQRMALGDYQSGRLKATSEKEKAIIQMLLDLSKPRSLASSFGQCADLFH